MTGYIVKNSVDTPHIYNQYDKGIKVELNLHKRQINIMGEDWSTEHTMLKLLYDERNYNPSKIYLKMNQITHLFEATPYVESNSTPYIENLDKDMENTDDCIVCYNTLNASNTVQYYCGHRLCMTCNYKWVYEQKKTTCPMCRAPFLNLFLSNNV